MSICILCPEGHPVIVAAGKLGGVAACPRCFTSFLVEADAVSICHARKEEPKARRSRDDDDDDDEDDEEEKPKKKRPAKKDDKEEKQPAKASRAKKKDDDEEDDEEEEDEEEEEEIKWNSRKRQLNICKTGSVIYMVAYWILVAFFVITMLTLDYFTFEVLTYIGNEKPMDKLDYSYAWVVLFGYIAGPFFALAELALMVGMFFSMAVPPKAEAKGLLLSGLVFGGVVFLLGILILLAQQGMLVDKDRVMPMTKLFGGGAALCFVVSIMSTMAYMSKLMIFMRLNMEASQPVTNTGFFFMFYLAMFVLFLANAYVCSYLHYMMGYVMIVAIDAMAGLGIRSLIAQTSVFLKVNKVITTYIKEA